MNLRANTTPFQHARWESQITANPYSRRPDFPRPERIVYEDDIYSHSSGLRNDERGHPPTPGSARANPTVRSAI